jgi:DNA-binding NarL/FixJ family response regulator
MPVTMLVVGDHGVVRGALRGWLEITFPGCHVMEAVASAQAVAMAEVSSPNVVIVDIGPPGMNGVEVIARLKASVPGTSVVVLTSYEAEAQRARVMASGASACVPQDNIAQLQASLAELLSSMNKPSEIYDP